MKVLWVDWASLFIPFGAFFNQTSFLRIFPPTYSRIKYNTVQGFVCPCHTTPRRSSKTSRKILYFSHAWRLSGHRRNLPCVGLQLPITSSLSPIWILKSFGPFSSTRYGPEYWVAVGQRRSHTPALHVDMSGRPSPELPQPIVNSYSWQLESRRRLRALRRSRHWQ